MVTGIVGSGAVPGPGTSIVSSGCLITGAGVGGGGSIVGASLNHHDVKIN